MSKNVLILERSSKNLQQVSADSSKTVLEGIFAEFGVENRNGRIYEEREYLPHLEYLKNDIKNGSLLGELDHPERFEVALNNVSHKITELWYDQGARQIKGKIEVLGTPKGAIAKELLKAGIPLSISSRAAGTVNEDKTVSIQQIYTYDLVAKPGFENAQLKNVNESAQARINGLVQKLNESSDQFNSKVSNIAPTIGIINENISIYDEDKFPTPKKFREEALQITNVKNKKESKPMKMNENQKISEETLQQWSTFVQSEFAKINERLDRFEDSVISGGGQGSSKDIKVLKSYVNKLRNLSEGHINWTKDIAKSVNKLGRYSDTIAKKSNEHYKKTQKIEETVDYNAKVLNHTQDWVGNNAKITNAIGETVDHNASMLNKMNEWTEEIAKGVNALNEWGEEKAKAINDLNEWSEEKAKAINGIHEWTSSIAKGLNETATWSEDMFGRAMSKSDAQKLISYIELVGESKKDPELKKKLEEALAVNSMTGKSINESIKGLKVIDSVKTVGNSKVDTNAGKATGVEFDGKIIVAKIKKTKGLSKSTKPKHLKTLTGDVKTVKVNGGSGVKGMHVMDKTKVIHVSKDSKGSPVKASTHNLKLNVKPEGKLKESLFSKSSSIKERQSKLDEKLALIINNLEKEKAIVNESKQEFPFVSLLNESDQKAFSSLSRSEKEKISSAVKKNPTTDSGIIKSLWENSLRGDVKEQPIWLASAPSKYKKLYESADERMKGSIDAMAEYRVLETQYQINNFWETSPLATKVSSLNEVFTPSKVNNNTDEMDSFVKAIGSQMERYN